MKESKMENFALLNEAMELHPELLEIFIGDDEVMAFAKAQEIAPAITAAEFAAYRLDRKEIVPAAQSLFAVLDKLNEDSLFAAKVNTCEDVDSIYELCKEGDLIKVTKACFAAFFNRFREAWDSRANVELTDSELAVVVGGSNSYGTFLKSFDNKKMSLEKIVAIVPVVPSAA